MVDINNIIEGKNFVKTQENVFKRDNIEVRINSDCLNLIERDKTTNRIKKVLVFVEYLNLVQAIDERF